MNEPEQYQPTNTDERRRRLMLLRFRHLPMPLRLHSRSMVRSINPNMVR